MENIKVFNDLHLFSSYNKLVDLSFNQYLLLGSEPLLIHTGSIDQTIELLPKIKSILGERALSYIFISHFESDECGGLRTLMDEYPQVKPICSQITARQLIGFGLANDIIIKAPNDILESEDYKLRFIGYPSEMHLWEGLVAFEENRSLLFSSDLFIRHGEIKDTIINSNWTQENREISIERIPSQTALKNLQETLANFDVKYILPGHGPCIKAY